MDERNKTSSLDDHDEANGLTKQEINEICKVAKNIIENNEIITSLEFEKCNLERYITTGCKAIDTILEGGIPVRGITEISGEAGAGKTQICLQLTLTVQYNLEYGGLSSGALYICTEDVFPSKRLNELIQYVPKGYFSGNRSNMSDNIFIDHVVEADKFDVCINTKLPQLLRSRRIGLIVIDSIAGIYRFEYEKEQNVERSKDMQLIGQKLIQLSDQYKVAIICINQITDNIASNSKISALGLSWSKYVTTRISISRTNNVVTTSEFSNNCVRKFAIESAPNLPCHSCPFIITAAGIKDIG